jgi:glycosyltransferase involved in cell wall biosynthesis
LPAPLVSILIPCYNAAPWLAATIESCFAQTWTAHEIVLVDDGSTDNSLSIARNFERRGVRVISQPNRGASAARNEALRASCGDYIQFLDADDLLAADKLERQLSALAEAGPDVLSSGNWGRFSTNPARAEFRVGEVSLARNGVEFLQLHYETCTMMQPAAWLTPRSLIERAGPWNESLSLNDDGEYFARVALAARRIVFVASARTFYRTTSGGSLSARRDIGALHSLYRSVELTLEHLRAADDSPRTRRACARAWMRVAVEIYPALPELSARAEQASRAIGVGRAPLPGSGRFQIAARLLGWRLARRLFSP